MCTTSHASHAGEPHQCALKGHSILAMAALSADRCHVALVEVVEFGARLALEILPDHAGHVRAHLHGRLRDSGIRRPFSSTCARSPQTKISGCPAGLR